MKQSPEIPGNDILAPCGINCSLCMAYLREKNVCTGCRMNGGHKSRSCMSCSIKNCELLAETVSGYCYECAEYPCDRLKRLGKRYKMKYHTDIFANFDMIREYGVEHLIRLDREKWRCPDCGGTVCMHRGYCLKCGDKAKC